MQAIVVGIKELDFKADDGPVKRTVYYVNHPASDVEGYETGSVSWDELRKGAPPLIGIGEVIDVEYNRRGKLVLSEKIEIASPAPAAKPDGKQAS